MGKLSVDLKGGQAPGAFTCTGCKRTCSTGDDYLEIHMADGLWGPLCIDCWHKVPRMFEMAVSHPGLSIDTVALGQQIQARYEAAKARGN
jgi:hypothetical protein